MTHPLHTQRRRVLPLCLGLLLAAGGLAACERRNDPPRDPGGSPPVPGNPPTNPPPGMPASEPSMPPASGPRP